MGRLGRLPIGALPQALAGVDAQAFQEAVAALLTLHEALLDQARQTRTRLRARDHVVVVAMPSAVDGVHKVLG